MTAHENPHIGPTDLPPNIFAIFIYLAGGQSARMACTSLIVSITCLTALYLHRLAMRTRRRAPHGQRGHHGPVRDAGRPLTTRATCTRTPSSFASPVAAVGSAIRVSRKFSLLHAGIGVVALLALWHVRFYMVFLAMPAIVAVGYMGFGSGSWLRPAISAVLVGVALWALAVLRAAPKPHPPSKRPSISRDGRKGDTRRRQRLRGGCWRSSSTRGSGASPFV